MGISSIVSAHRLIFEWIEISVNWGVREVRLRVEGSICIADKSPCSPGFRCSITCIYKCNYNHLLNHLHKKIYLVWDLPDENLLFITWVDAIELVQERSCCKQSLWSLSISVYLILLLWTILGMSKCRCLKCPHYTFRLESLGSQLNRYGGPCDRENLQSPFVIMEQWNRW